MIVLVVGVVTVVVLGAGVIVQDTRMRRIGIIVSTSS